MPTFTIKDSLGEAHTVEAGYVSYERETNTFTFHNYGTRGPQAAFTNPVSVIEETATGVRHHTTGFTITRRVVSVEFEVNGGASDVRALLTVWAYNHGYTFNKLEISQRTEYC